MGNAGVVRAVVVDEFLVVENGIDMMRILKEKTSESDGEIHPTRYSRVPHLRSPL